MEGIRKKKGRMVEQRWLFKFKETFRDDNMKELITANTRMSNIGSGCKNELE